MRKSRVNTKKIALFAVFTALAFLMQFVFRIKVSFLTFDAKDAVLCIGAMFFGPVSGVIMSLAVAFLEFITISETGFWGFLMNFFSSSAFSMTASAIYTYAPKVKKKLSGSLIGLICSVIVTTGVMMLLNLLITPIFQKVDRAMVVGLIPVLLLPFNLTKTIFNAALTLVLYKPISVALHRSRVLGEKPMEYKFGTTSIAITVIGIAVIAACVMFFLFALHGSVELA